MSENRGTNRSAGREWVERCPWRERTPPRRILAIRLQAIGDVVITLPCLQSLKTLYPDAQIEFLTGEEAHEIPASVGFLDRVHVLKGGRVPWRRLPWALRLLPELRRRRYDVVVDLQRNGLSRLIRRAIHPPAFSEFDRFGPYSAADRTREAIEAAGLPPLPPFAPLAIARPDDGMALLSAAGWRPGRALVVLNPAGAFPSRNWPIQRYVEFSHLCSARMGSGTLFLVLGTDRIGKTALVLKQALGEQLVNLAGRTRLSEALALLHAATLVLTEDSALLHMAWACGIPTVALLGSTRADWACPSAASHVVCLHSGDLPCRFCMEETCPMGDTRCLQRYTPERVADLALGLLARRGGEGSLRGNRIGVRESGAL